MGYDHLSDLPDWDDDEFKDEDNEGEEWRPNPTKDACRDMYKQWQQVMIVLENKKLGNWLIYNKDGKCFHHKKKCTVH